MKFTRYGIYYTPENADFAAAGAAWLGWDIRLGVRQPSPQPQVVARPQKYGFHATIKPPFRLAPDHDLPALETALEDLASRLNRVTLGALKPQKLGAFIAFCAEGDTRDLNRLAAQSVRDLDRFRAPSTREEIEKRLRPDMPETLRKNLYTWGYPHVLDAFRFHMTLTGPVRKGETDRYLQQIARHFDGTYGEPVTLSSLTLVGEQPDGYFVEIRRFGLGGL